MKGDEEKARAAGCDHYVTHQSSEPAPGCAPRGQRQNRQAFGSAFRGYSMNNDRQEVSMGLQPLGWTVGRNLRVDYRWGAGNADNVRKFAAELVALANRRPGPRSPAASPSLWKSAMGAKHTGRDRNR
jgi:hypothetical protein